MGVKVLFVSGLQVHPARSGGNLRSFGLASALQRHGLDVFVYSLVGRKDDYLARRPSGVQAWPGGIPEYVDRQLPGFAAQYASYALGLPPVWLTAYLRAAVASPREALLPRALRERLAWCDVVLADFPFVHPVFHARAARGRLRVASTHNVEHSMHDDASRWRNRWLREKVRAIEIEAASASDVLVACCASDRHFFETEARVRRSILVPNGIDESRFGAGRGERARTRQALGIAEDVRLFLFTASRYGPNAEAFDYLVAFARDHRALLERERIDLLVVGNVCAGPRRWPGLTATGRVDAVEPFFAAADAALNPMWSGAGTNVKMCEFLAARLPILTSPFGARGFRLADGETALFFERDGLAAALVAARRLLDGEPDRLRRMADQAYARNADVIDMEACVRPLAEALKEERPRDAEAARAARLPAAASAASAPPPIEEVGCLR
jgi:glycosyl transferase family 1/glycosyl transferase family 4